MANAPVVDGIPQLTADDAAQRVDQGAVLLDVREPDEWHAGHAPAARHLALGRVVAEHAQVLDATTPVVAICRSGARSHRAALALKAAGYDIVNVAGGMQAWAAAGHPVVTDDGRPGNVI